MPHFSFFTLLRLVVIIVVALSGVYTAEVSAQEPQSLDMCADVRHLMALDTTPYELGVQGGELVNGQQVDRILSPNDFADFWSFNLAPSNDGQSGPTASLNLTFENVTGDPLEFAVFNGMTKVQDYVSLPPQAYEPIMLPRFGQYTIVVRRVHVAEQANASYKMTFELGGTPRLSPLTTQDILNAVTNQPFTPQSQIQAGTLAIALPSSQLWVHPDSTRLVNPRGGQYAQIFFPDDSFRAFNAYSMSVGPWAQKITFLGGDFAAVSLNPENPRIYYVEDYAYRNTITGASARELELTDLSFSDGTRVAVDWTAVRGVWITKRCSGVKLKDGRAFTAATPAENRQVHFSGTLESFLVELNTQSQANQVQPFRLQIDLNNVEAQSTVEFDGDRVHVQLVHQRQLVLQSNDVNLASQEPLADRPGRIDGALLDQNASFSLDWINMDHVEISPETITLGFTDQPRSATTRSGVGLLRLEAQDDVVHLVYKGRESNIPGEERLLLPASESYLEIVSPEGLPAFDGRSLPGEPGYSARALNNTGGECSPTGTLPEPANCPPNGHPNPANGNLWLAIPDALAEGDLVNLGISRSYNSRLAAVDGPFGRGWSSEYPLDYNVPFDPATSSRTVTPDSQNYPVGLDLTWSPRGIVTYVTASGSRHTFVSTQPAFTGGVLRAITMPGWTLTHTDLRDPIWRLQTENGESYEFDRAGRLLRYGFPENGRQIQIDYPATNLNGPGGLDVTQPIIIQDVTSGFAPRRQLELYYDENHHVGMTRLRDLGVTTEGDCAFNAGCLQTTYEYSDGLLTRVIYFDGQIATYSYDDAGYLVEHHDPRAPISPMMQYAYDETGGITNITLVDANGQSHPWRQLHVNASGGNERVVAVTDEWGNERRYAYVYDAGELRGTGATFTLRRETSPLASVDPFEAIPQEYEWANGLLTRIQSRVNAFGEGRNGIDFQYAASSAQISCVACSLRGIPEIRVAYESNAQVGLPSVITYADNSTETFRYVQNSSGRIQQYVDRNGATYNYIWSESIPYRVAQVEREQDGVIWRYEYGALGLVTNVIQFAGDNDPGYAIGFEYDGLGRLVRINDSSLGSYTVAYELVNDESAQRVLQRLIVTDPIGAIEITDFDARGNMVEQRTVAGSDVLSRTTYTYDVYGRLTSNVRWHIEDAIETPFSTRYDYQPLGEIAPVRPGERSIPVLGYQLTITDAYSRREQHVYDALGRLRMTTDKTGTIQQYNYLVDDTGQNLGLRVEERTFYPDSETPQIRNYFFDARWQLRGVRTPSQQWQLTPDGDSTRQASLTLSTNNGRVLQQSIWSEYENGQTTGFSLRQPQLQLNGVMSLDNWFRPNVNIGYDFVGRPQQVIDGEGNRRAVAYCPQDRGYIRHLYSQIGAASIACESSDYALALIFDPGGRLIEAADASGTRRFVYAPDVNLHQWIVNITLIDDVGTTRDWLIGYDALGRQIIFRTEAAVEHYRYDTLGRLTTVDVDGQPEASYRFEYNAADMLTRVTDGVGRGYSYSYDTLGNVTNRIDERSAYATSFAYNSVGTLTSLISPQGAAVAFLHEDEEDPTRITGSIDPAGNRRTYTWDDDNLTLRYTDVAGSEVIYQFDSVGLLWRIEDALLVGETSHRAHELRYNNAGEITDWLFDFRQNDRAARHLEIDRETPYRWLVSETGGRAPISLPTLLFASNGDLTQMGDVELDYDAIGRLRALGIENFQWNLGYDPTQPIVTVNDPFLQSTSLSYDALYRRVNEGDIRYEYSPQLNENQTPTGRIELTVHHPIDGERKYIFSPGNARRNESPNIAISGHGQRVVYTFNDDDTLDSIEISMCIDPAIDTVEACQATGGVWTQNIRFYYDTLGQPIRATDENGNSRVFAYDSNGNLITYQDQVGRTFTYSYDRANRLTRLVSPTGMKLLFAYNTLDRLVGICRTHIQESDDYEQCRDRGGEIETYIYDSLGRLSTRNFPSNSGAGGRAPITYQYGDNLNSPETVNFGDQRQINLNYDALGLLDSLRTPEQEYRFRYSALNRLAAADQLDFGFGEHDRLETITTGGNTYHIDSSQDGYTLSDDNGGSIRMSLDARGLLSTIGTETPLLSAIYFENAMDVSWVSPQAILSYALDNQWRPLSLLYQGASTLGLFYEVDAAGMVLRQTLALPTDEMQNRTSLVRASSFDSGGRPLTLRITQVTDSQADSSQETLALYTQTFTYDERGNRIQELHQYRDQSQMEVIQQYDGSRISTRTIRLYKGSPVEATSGAWLMAGVLLLLVFRRRRFGVIVVTVVVAVWFVTSDLQLRAQQAVSDYQYEYSYDVAGNLAQIDVTSSAQDKIICAQMTYDSMSRLVRLVRQGAVTYYSYDAFGRLAQADDMSLVYPSESGPFVAVQQQGNSLYFAQAENHPPLFAIDQSGTRFWFLNDGQRRIIGVLDPESGSTSDLWLFDSLDRHITFDPPSVESDPCQISTSPSGIPASLRLMPLADGAVWDAKTNLYFIDGRAYDPGSGQFLQANLDSPDVLGSTYAFPMQAAEPPVRERVVQYREGLEALSENLETVNINQTLSAEFIAEAHLHTIGLFNETDTWTNVFDQARAPYDEMASSMLNLPRRLENGYNSPAPVRDPETGALTLSLGDLFHGASNLDRQGSSLPINLPRWTESIGSVKPAGALVVAVLQQRNLPHGSAPTALGSDGWDALTHGWLTRWMPQNAPSLVPAIEAPDAVLEWLPATLTSPEVGLLSLDAAAMTTEWSMKPNHQIVSELLDQALPSMPSLPPTSIGQWLDSLFTTNLAGLDENQTPFSLPDIPTIPSYRFGFNFDWLNVLD